VLPVETGIALLVQTPSGAQVLVDGGADASELLTQLGTVMGFWDRSLDLLLLSTADKRSAATQSALPTRLLAVGALGPPPTASAADAAVDAWARALEAAAVPVTRTAAGGWVDLGDGVSLWAQAPPTSAPGKAQPLTWRLQYGDFKLLLPGSAGTIDVAADVLLLRAAAYGEGGRLTAGAPTLAVVYGAASLDEEAAPQGVAVRYPETDGAIHIWSDGHGWGWE
jgi:hypothetical protein